MSSWQYRRDDSQAVDGDTPSTASSSARSRLIQSLRGLPYERQLALVRPPVPPLSRPPAVVQQQADEDSGDEGSELVPLEDPAQWWGSAGGTAVPFHGRR
jgi:hypothetical protein